jgi:3-deoxy-D-manno-octulosonic-acid transferase
MKNIWYFSYNLLILPLIKLFLLFARIFNKKIKIGLEGRKKLFSNLIIDLTGIDRKKQMVWFHSASMGEFEQAKPIIEKIRKHKNINIIVTFFSPSGYLNSLKYPHADIISYFPFDTPFLTSRFLNLVRPSISIFMRYDIWPNMIWQLNKRKIPTLIVDATMRKNSSRKLPIVKSFHNSLYSSITKILAVSDEDVQNFIEFNVEKSKIKAIGDTRFDRVYQKSIAAKEKRLFKDDFFAGKKVLVIGSSWENDEEVLLPAIVKLMKVEPLLITIIVPHEPTIYHIERLENTLSKNFPTIRFSYLNNYKNERVILIDSIGILLTLYSYADAAYVGGSFKQGIHNVLEPAVYGIPVFFGPKYHNSQEALKLISLKGAFTISDKKNTYRLLRKIFSDENFRTSAGKVCAEFVKENLGATQKIVDQIDKYIKH